MANISQCHHNGGHSEEELVLERHVTLWLKTNASAEDVGESSPLLRQGIHDRSAWRCQRSLEHIAKNAQHRVETTKILLGLRLPLDTRHHLGYEDEIDDERGCQKRVFADVKDRDGLVATEENLSIVLVKSTLVIANGGHVLDHDGVVRVLAFLVQDRVGGNHVVNDIGLGDFLGTELFLGGQVHSVVIAEMVVRGDGGELDACVDEEVNECGLHLSLAGFEVIAANEGIVLRGKLDSSGNEGVLWRAVNEGGALQDTGDGEDSGRGDFLMTVLDGIDEVVSSVVDTFDDVGIALSIGSPLDDDFIQSIGGFEISVKKRSTTTPYERIAAASYTPNILADLLHMVP